MVRKTHLASRCTCHAVSPALARGAPRATIFKPPPPSHRTQARGRRIHLSPWESATTAVRIPRVPAPKSSVFDPFGLGLASHGWLAISVISSRTSSLLAIDLDTFPSLSPRSSPSPSLALASRRHGPPSTPTPSQDALQPP
ncbi:hypothetical protein EDB85DRAFT_2138659 [Lactarius pseudohatsudake]|nr:hypothetical protein EDB85DRAFT_2138659 [Lactarius pseudohatsudake]